MLRGAALRVTGPRVAVLRALHDHPHADTDSVIGVVREDLGVVSHQAVYDVLRALTAAGLVRRIQPAGSVARYEVRVGDKRMPLTLMEASLLRYFVQREGCPVPRKAILEQVWGLRDDTDTRAIDNFVVRLRRYIEKDPANPRHLQTVRGVGYRFVANPE